MPPILCSPTMKIESVWDYPRPPALELFKGHVRIIHRNKIIADTNRAFRVLETSHPPVFYLPPEDLAQSYLMKNGFESYCEYKGKAGYYDLIIGQEKVLKVGWYYPSPTKAFDALKDHVAFYASKLDTCLVNDVPVTSQEGDFYGGWITPNIRGPFKGGPGTFGW